MDTVIGYLPVVLVALACPLMMVFMMRGMHGGHNSHDTSASCHSDQATETPEAKLQRLEDEVAALRSRLGPRAAHDDESLPRVDGAAMSRDATLLSSEDGQRHPIR